MRIGIVGHEAAKFTPAAEARAKELIRKLLSKHGDWLVSGHCHLGGIDLWAEEIAKELGRYDEGLIFPPKNYSWETGYKPRNQMIALQSHVVHCIVVDKYPPNYSGMRHDSCYHCGTSNHIKSGGCWTAKRSKMGKWHIIQQEA